MGIGVTVLKVSMLNGPFWPHQNVNADNRQEANARLIAAAPDLYEALENVIIAVGMNWDLEGEIDITQTALAKARGEKDLRND